MQLDLMSNPRFFQKKSVFVYFNNTNKNVKTRVSSMSDSYSYNLLVRNHFSVSDLYDQILLL